MKPRPHTHIAKANSLRRERLRNQLSVRRAAKPEGRDIYSEPRQIRWPRRSLPSGKSVANLPARTRTTMAKLLMMGTP